LKIRFYSACAFEMRIDGEEERLFGFTIAIDYSKGGHVLFCQRFKLWHTQTPEQDW